MGQKTGRGHNGGMSQKVAGVIRVAWVIMVA